MRAYHSGSGGAGCNPTACQGPPASTWSRSIPLTRTETRAHAARYPHIACAATAVRETTVTHKRDDGRNTDSARGHPFIQPHPVMVAVAYVFAAKALYAVAHRLLLARHTRQAARAAVTRHVLVVLHAVLAQPLHVVQVQLRHKVRHARTVIVGALVQRSKQPQPRGDFPV